MHEFFNMLHAPAGLEAQPFGNLGLAVKAQPVIAPSGHEMQMTAHRPQKILTSGEQFKVFMPEHAGLDEISRFARSVNKLGNPEKRMQIAQAALAVLDIGFDQIARFARTQMAHIAFSQCGGDKRRLAVFHDILVEALNQFIKQGLVSAQHAGLKHRGHDRFIALGKPDTFIDRAGRMTNLEPQVPKEIKNEFNDTFTPGGLFVRQQKQQIDV